MQASDRALLFWGACMPTRAYLATRGDRAWLRLLAAIIGFRWVSGSEKGTVGFFGGHAFWADDRPFHGLLWLLYSATGRAEFLQADTVYGGVNWVTR